ncbi:MAG: TrmH family RNA methyltransferase [Tissierellia bacterium]|nr:TrmH family RNA methyltransferase [Tissierellia bacterium]
MSYKVYSKKRPYSYTWGAYPTIELIRQRPELMERVLVHSLTDPGLIDQLKDEIDPDLIIQNDSLLEKLAQRENVYVLGVFRYQDQVIDQGNHILLEEPSNFGNLGTIIRTALGLGYTNIGLIGHSCDHHHPQVVRASMGAIFSVKLQKFADFSEYLEAFPHQTCYAFMGGSGLEISQLSAITPPYSLIFGNESRGLDQSIADFAIPVSIAMTDQVDSFNITIAAGIGMYTFANKQKLGDV